MKRLYLLLVLLLIASPVFAGTLEIDWMEYASDATAQAAYVNNSSTKLFGKNTIGTNSQGSNYTIYSKFTASSDDIVSHLAVYSAGNSNVKIALYSDSGGEPNALLASATGAVTAGLTLIPITPVSISNGSSYWIADNYETNNMGYLDPSGGTRRYKSETYSTWTFPATYDGTGFSADSSLHAMSAYAVPLQSYSEGTIKTQGSYALKAIANTAAINKTLTKTFAVNSNLTGVKNLRFDAYASRTGGQWKLGIHDTGGTTTEITPTIGTANTWQPVNWDLSAVTDANKNAIDTLTLTITNADSANTFYLDYAEIAQAIDVFGWVS